MNIAILFPFIVVTIVAIVLTAILIGEKDYFFNYRSRENKSENDNQSREEKKSTNNHKHPWDLWSI
jgi:hypothetical protein